MLAARLVAFAALGSLAACQAGDATSGTIDNSPTVLIVNGSCATGHCDSVEVLAFPTNHPVTPAGPWTLDLGLMTGPQLCVRLPHTATFVVSGPGTDGVMRSDTTRWTPAASLSLGAVSPAQAHWAASPATAAFVPESSVGWRVTLPGTQVAADAPCVP